MLSKAFLFVTFSLISVSFCGKYCKDYDTYGFTRTPKYCDNGCCGGTSNDRTPCCDSSNGGAAAAGGVITTLIVIAVICVVIYRVRFRTSRVEVIQNSAPSTSVTIATTQQTVSQTPQYNPPPVQPQYYHPGQPTYPPPYSTGTSHSYSKTQYM